MKYICDGRECEYTERCASELIDVTTLEDVLDGIRVYVRGANNDDGVCKRDLSSDL